MTDTSETKPTASLDEAVSKIPEAARDFVRQAAETGKEGAARVQSGAQDAAATVQDIASVSLSGSVQIANCLIKAAHQNVEATLGLVGKLAGAKSVGDAATVQLDFLQDYGKANVEQLREIAEIAQKGYADIEKAVREGYAKVKPKQAA